MPVLAIEEREIISREISAGRSSRYIGRLLGRHHSTIADEIKRNGGRSDYRAVGAHERARRKRSRPKPRKLVDHQPLHDFVAEGLERKWSPQQIAAKLVEEFPDDESMRCHTRRSTRRCSFRPAASYAPS